MTEAPLELEAIGWLVETGYQHVCGHDIAPMAKARSGNASCRHCCRAVCGTQSLA